MNLLKAAGFSYDSSIHPTWVPGRYNHLARPTRTHLQDGIVRVPVAVSPLMRLPVSWIWFRNYPKSLLQILGRSLAARRDALCLYFHNWEFVDLQRAAPGLPRSVARNTGEAFARRLARFVELCKKRGFVPCTIIEHVRSGYDTVDHAES